MNIFYPSWFRSNLCKFNLRVAFLAYCDVVLLILWVWVFWSSQGNLVNKRQTRRVLKSFLLQGSTAQQDLCLNFQLSGINVLFSEVLKGVLKKKGKRSVFLANSSLSGNRTPVSRVTVWDTHHYTNRDLKCVEIHRNRSIIWRRWFEGWLKMPRLKANFHSRLQVFNRQSSECFYTSFLISHRNVGSVCGWSLFSWFSEDFLFPLKFCVPRLHQKSNVE